MVLMIGNIICLNEDEKRGRLYQITELGKKVVKEKGEISHE